MRADPGHTALVQHDDAVGMADRADALRHDQAGRVAQLARQTGAEAGIGAVIQRGERIIKDEDLRLAGQCARDGKALLLAAGDVCARLCDRRIELAGQLVHKFRGLRQRERALHGLVVLRGAAFAEQHIAAHVARKHNGPLRHITDAVVERIEAVAADILPVDEHLPLRCVIEAGRKADKRRFAAAGRADEGDGLALVCAEAHMLEHVAGRRRIAERDIAEFHGPLLRGFGRFSLMQGDRRIEHLVDADGRDLRHRQQNENHDEHHK